ncbi:MAG: ParB/RepB/Spo0J family partition protein [Hornefia sp.]|nr:ParB/RepB/Spo0J family partition protein [Hornefia sp.]
MSGKLKKSRGLGRGLDALFADQAPIVPEQDGENTSNISKHDGADADRVLYIDINDIKPNGDQPRKTFDREKISELSQSIVEHGIIQPLVVRKSGKHYEIVAGERRWRAAREAGLSLVPCILRQFSDEENMLVAIIENMQREDLNPIEEAMGLEQMINVYGLTQEEVSKSVSKSRPYITNKLRLLKLPEEIKKLVGEGEISTGHARALITVSSKAKQAELCKKIIEEGISVRELEKLASEEKKPRKKPLKRVKSPDTLNVERELKEIYGTKVTINQKGNKGMIKLEFYSKGELNRLIDLLKCKD